jgi:hypothetical protein
MILMSVILSTTKNPASFRTMQDSSSLTLLRMTVPQYR